MQRPNLAPEQLAWLLGVCLVSGCGPSPREVAPAARRSPGAPPASAAVADDPADPVAACSELGDTRGQPNVAETAMALAPEASSAGTGAPPVVPHLAAPMAKPATPGKSGVHPPAPSAKRYEPVFEQWPKPHLVLFITGQLHGHMEPCGCTGLANQKGGLSRRFTFHKSLLDRGWDVLALDAGNQVARSGRQAEIKFQMATEALRKIGYRAIGLGADDLRLSVGELIAITASDGSKPNPFVCANTAIIDRSLMPRYQVFEVADKKIGVTGVLAADRLAKVTSDEVLKMPAEQALREVWPELEKQHCDLYVLMAQASVEDTRRLAQQFPRFDLVVSADEVGEPTYKLETVPQTHSLLVQVGVKAMYVCVVGVFDDAPRLRYQRVPLDDRFADSREMLELLASYQTQLQTAGLAGLAVKPIPHPSGRTFVGSKDCQDCHDEDYDVWKASKHAHALQTLIQPGERSEVPRYYDPECLSCHVVGWNPQKHFPYASGYLGVDETPQMHHVGCEGCHGPGSAHVAAENGKIDKLTDELRDKLRVEVRLALQDAEKKCMECHDMDNSPDFHLPGAFEKYWHEIEH